MVSFPPCKINLGLHILAKRNDGYHDLETCFFPVPWTDILEIIPAQELSFTASGNAIPGESANNLCLKAYRLMQEHYKISPVAIHLHKTIPTGAGLGGGSSDAAYTLRMLNTLFELGLDTRTLMQHAATLGSDCAFFIQDDPMIGEARGEKLSTTSLQLKKKYLVLIKPDIHVSTVDAYAHVTPKAPEKPLRAVLEQALPSWKNSLLNDFEPSVFSRFPAIEKLKTLLYEHGALYASMSGSGASVFGIFDTEVPVPIVENALSWSGML